MNKLNKKRLRDIKINKMQFLNIAIMIFLGMFAFSGVHSYMDGMKVSGDNYYKENNLQDLWVVGESFNKNDLDEVNQISNVKKAEGIFTIRTDLENFDNVALETNFIEENDISKMYVVNGEGFAKDKKGVWVDSYLAKNLKLNVGDEITFKYQNMEFKEKINGLVTTPDHVYTLKDETAIFPTHKDFGYVYLSKQELPKEMQNMYNQIIVDVDDVSKQNEVKSEIENKVKSTISVTDRVSNVSYKCYQSEIEEGKTYSRVFTILFLFIAILSVVTTMNRFIKKERTQIGTLKALGFKNRKITLYYIGYGFWISVISVIIGIILGNTIVGNVFLNEEMAYFEVPKYQTIIIPQIYLLAIIIVVVITLVTYLACRSILRESAVETLRVEVPKMKKIKFDLTSKGILKNASISTKWNLRDMARNKGRVITGIIGVIGCTLLLVSALGMMDTMNSYIDWEFKELNDFNYKLSLTNDYTSEQLKNLEDKYGKNTSMTLDIEFENNGSKVANSIFVSDAKDCIKYADQNKKYMNLEDDGLYVTEKMAEKYNLKIGDEIKWHFFGDEKWYTSKIVGINRDPQNQIMNMSRKYYESCGLKYKEEVLYTKSDLSNVKSLDGVQTIQSKDYLKNGIQDMMQTIRLMIVLLIVISAILDFVIIYNLGVLSFSEKEYQFATLKVLGFKDKQIKKIYIKQNLWITCLGIIIGLPAGYLLLSYIFTSALGQNYDFPAVIKLNSYIFAGVGSFVVSLLVNKILSNKVKNIDMVSSLKANE